MGYARPSTLPIAFDPDLGAEKSIYRRLVRAAVHGSDNVVSQLSRELEGASGPAALFSLNVLRDIISAGGRVWARDSRLYVSWPDWAGPNGRTSARKALELARDLERAASVDVARLAPMFLNDIRPVDLLRLAREGKFELVSVHDIHPSGLSYMEGFSAALHYWSMPYRGRTGRKIRFVLTVRHATLAPQPSIVGIIELGDEAPFCAWRDDLIGLSALSTENWFIGGNPERALAAERRLRRIRRALRPLESGLDLAALPATEILSRKEEIESLAAGRSTVEDHEHDVLFDRRRAIYALRLALGESALRVIATGGEYTPGVRRMLSQGNRGLRDLMVPRLHLEVTVCGAIPPFSEALGGKLVVAQFAHPRVIQAVRTPLGDLVGRTFFADALAEEVFSPGMIAITTKGLYAGHSPLYNRSSVPGKGASLIMRKIAETAGQTSTLMSKATAVAARRLVLANEVAGERKVSNMYGSGGAKRHRVLEVAARQAGLSMDVVNAGIRRPVYGMAFVDNPEAVAWENASPLWKIDSDENEVDYVSRAVEEWRKRWLIKAEARLKENDILPSLLTEVIKYRSKAYTL